MNTTLLQIPAMRFATIVRRLGVAALIACSLLAGAPDPAHASPNPIPPSHTSRCTPGESIELAGAIFSPRRAESGLAWDARFIVDVDAASDFRGGTLPLAVPLPPGETLVPTPGIEAELDGDRLVALCVAPDAIRGRTLFASFAQPAPRSGRDAIALGAPVAASGAVQIVDTSVGDARLEVSDAPLLEKHVGYIAARTISAGARAEARRLTEVRARLSASPLYLRGEDVRVAGGLTARIVEPRVRARESALGVALAFAGIAGALVLAARRLQRSASIERADAVLASEIDATSKELR